MKLQPQNPDYLFVGIQLVLFVLFFWSPGSLDLPSLLWMRIAGVLLALVGMVYVVWPILQLNRALTMFPTPRSGSSLITTGAFAHVRHPIYTGIWIGGVGVSLYYADGIRLLLACALLLLFYFKSGYEEKRLMQVFPDYADYKKHTGRFFPKLF